MTNRFDILLHPDDVRWAAAEGVSETVIAAVLLLHERSVKEIAAELSAAELEQVIKLVGRSPRIYPPGTLDALKQRRALVSPVPPQRSGESTRSDVAAGKQHAGTPRADPRGQPETRTRARPDAGTDRRSVIDGVALRTLSGAKPLTHSSSGELWYRRCRHSGRARALAVT
jgi:hypothetical protein